MRQNKLGDHVAYVLQAQNGGHKGDAGKRSAEGFRSGSPTGKRVKTGAADPHLDGISNGHKRCALCKCVPPPWPSLALKRVQRKRCVSHLVASDRQQLVWLNQASGCGSSPSSRNFSESNIPGSRVDGQRATQAHRTPLHMPCNNTAAVCSTLAVVQR